MKKLLFRRANMGDISQIAFLLTNGFQSDFAILGKEKSKVLSAIEDGIQVDKFFVALLGGELVGVLALTDRLGRAITVDEKIYKKHFGFFKGIIASLILRETLTEGRRLTKWYRNKWIYRIFNY